MARRRRSPGSAKHPREASSVVGDAARLAAALFALGLLVYWPAIEGPFVSDDRIYLPENPWVQNPTLENLLGFFDPESSNNLVTANYSPVHLLAHTAQWAAFGPRTTGYHVTSLLLHAVVGVLFAAWLLRAGAPRLAAAGGAAVFVLHPASAEVACWISQLKTLLSMAFALGALLLRRRSRIGAAALFVLGLLTKPVAAVALPVLLAQLWNERGEEGSPPVDRVTPLLWSALFAGFAIVALTTFGAANFGIPPVSEDPWIVLLSAAAFGARYLAMFATTYGVSAFQEPPAASGLGDPWVLLALVLGAALGARIWVAARRRLPELPFWIWAAASFVPVAQFLPFRYPMGDRYLYFILPGLVGGVWFAAADLWQHVPSRRRANALRGVQAGLVAVLLVFCVQSRGRAGIWTSESAPTLEAIARWPEGGQAYRLRGRALVFAERWDEALPQLRVAAEMRVITLPHVLRDPILGPRMEHPQLRPLIRDIAETEVRLLSERPQTTEYGLLRLAQAQLVLRRFEAARESLDAAAALDGAYGEIIEQLRELADARKPLVAGFPVPAP